MELHAEEGIGRVNLLSGDLSFTLNDGYTAILGREERRVYDEIINSNVGVNVTTAFEGGYLIFPEASIDHCLNIDDQVRNILSKSYLAQPDVERVW